MRQKTITVIANYVIARRRYDDEAISNKQTDCFTPLHFVRNDGEGALSMRGGTTTTEGSSGANQSFNKQIAALHFAPFAMTRFYILLCSYKNLLRNAG